MSNMYKRKVCEALPTNRLKALTILTWNKNLCFAEFSTKFIEIQSWLLLIFFICLRNQLSSFNSIKWFRLSVIFTAKRELVFVLTFESAFT